MAHALSIEMNLSEMGFNFGQITKSGELNTSRLVPRFKKLDLPVEIATDYLDDIVKLIPGACRKEYNYDKTMKTDVVVFGPLDDYIPVAKLAPQKEKWFEAIDRAIGRLVASHRPVPIQD